VVPGASARLGAEEDRNPGMTRAYAYDLDSTVCDTSHRHHLINEEERHLTDWVAYSMACADDEPLTGTISLLQQLRLLDDDAVFIAISGRAEQARELTVEWLTKFGVPFDRIILREPQAVGTEGQPLHHDPRGIDDPRYRAKKNEDLKRDELLKLRAEGIFVQLMIDDWFPVQKACAQIGIPCVIVATPYDDKVMEAHEADMQRANLR
jgi:hypothetical protein